MKQIIKKSFRKFINAPLLLLYSIILDIGFLIAYSFSKSAFTGLIGTNIANYAPSFTKDFAVYGFSALLSKESLWIIILLFASIIIYYVIYCIFQGSAWFVSFRICRQKIHFKGYLRKFFAVNFWWMLAYLLYSVNDFMLSFRIKLSPQDFSPLKYALPAVFFILALIAFASYVFLDFKKTINFISNNLLHALKAYLFILIVFLALDYVLIWLRFNKEAQLFLGLLLVFLLFSFSRVFIIESFKTKD